MPSSNFEIPVDVWERGLGRLALDIYVKAYNGILDFPCSIDDINDAYPDKSPAAIRRALKELHQEDLVDIKKLRDGRRAYYEYDLADPAAVKDGQTCETSPIVSRVAVNATRQPRMKPAPRRVAVNATCQPRTNTGVAAPPSEVVDFSEEYAPGPPGAYVFESPVVRSTTGDEENHSSHDENSSNSETRILQDLKSIISSSRTREEPPKGGSGFVPARMRKGAKRYSRRALREHRAKDAISGPPSGRRAARKVVEVDEADWDLATRMNHASKAKLKHYLGNPHLVFKPMAPGGRVFSCMLKAAKLAEELGVEPEVYVESQFFWFDRWFARPPKVWEMASGKGTMPPRKRVEVYQKIQEDESGTIARVVRSCKKLPAVSMPELMTYNRRLLKDLMSDGLSKSECLRDYPFMFHPMFLEADPDYLRLRSEGVVA